MDSQLLNLTRDDFLNSGWKNIISSCESKNCHEYSRVFRRQAKQAEETGKVKEQKIFELLAAVTSTVLGRRESMEEVFLDSFQHITDEQTDFLSAIAPDISDPELQARIADLLWSIKRNYRMAQLAIPAYLKSATELEDPEKRNLCFYRIERAYQLALSITYQIEAVISHIETVLDRYNGEDPLWLSAKLMRLLQKDKDRVDDPEKYSALAEKAAMRSETTHQWDIAREYWEITAKWHRMKSDREKELTASMSAAETYVKEAEGIVKQNPPSYLRSSHCLEKAIEAFRSIRGTKEEKISVNARSEEVHKLLIEYQEHSQQELILISVPCDFDVSKLIKFCQECVRGKEFLDALFSLAVIPIPNKVSELRQEVLNNSQEYIGLALFREVIINEMGKTIARQPSSLLSKNSDESEKAIDFQMNRQASFKQIHFADPCISVARKQIYLEHPVRISDFFPLVLNNPFVPRGRELLFAKGLYAGLTGDFFTSTHILIPQIENSVRYLLQKNGHIASGYDDRGIQNEHNLNSTLYRPEITEIFDEDTLFDLKNLLVEHSGSNLRNLMAHGLIDDTEFNSNPIMLYLWWVVLRLCYIPILKYQKAVEQSDPWVKFSGMFQDDPQFDEFVEEMEDYRRKIDDEAADREIISEENPSA
ncbi:MULTISPECIES: DUF4209 domain-containing protein [Spirulina sp. CCY15215]|uniref:DUF4209 domain-containing protein n=1 Tax=Spirulina sp. CCY15215 TaxID=2767591 RepID=UPI00194E28A8|nr:DUF4209 domain-containing protein [Spirulina major]